MKLRYVARNVFMNEAQSFVESGEERRKSDGERKSQGRTERVKR